MARIGAKNTKPEMAVRSTLHKLGYRFRLHSTDLPGKPDIVLKKYNTVIFVHGCFWHQHKGCKRSNMPKSNVAYWTSKLTRNSMRDRSNRKQLEHLGWTTLVIWECKTKNDQNLNNYLVENLPVIR